MEKQERTDIDHTDILIPYSVIIIIILAETPEIEQGLEWFLRCVARKSEQTLKDLLIIVHSEPPPFYMTYKYFTVVSKLRKAIYRCTYNPC